MIARARRLLGRLFQVGDARTSVGRALLQARYRALQRQVPLLYLVALTNYVGLWSASRAPLTEVTHPANLLIAFIVARLVYWVRTSGRALEPERIVTELRRTLVFAAILSLGFGFWSIKLVWELPEADRDLVILFASLAALGCAYGLASFPAAARLPLLLFAMPLALWLIASPSLVHSAVGFSLAMVTLLVLRLLNLQNKGFAEMVRSRTQVERQRERAERAEQAALKEKARVRQVADSDPLTGLANRRFLLAALEERLGRARGERFTLALLDLDGFKPINDTFGHAAGDSVLVEVAARLAREAGEGAVVARIGGDEFALILPIRRESEAVREGVRICAALGRPYRIAEREFRISACCGLTLLKPGEANVTTALSRGDAALYSGKQSGRGCVALFTPELEQANRRRTDIERALRDPEVKDQFGLAFQPIFDLADGGIRAFEALARWDHPELGPIAPSEFIPITEQINVIEEISGELLARAAAEAARWPDDILLSFNLSAVELHSTASARRLLGLLRAQGFDPARLQIEVTETALLADFDTARLNLERLRKAGARIVLDDFGAGFASITYLREMNFDAIKLDGSLVTGAGRSESALRLLKGVLDLTAALGVPCIAEHIENGEQLALLRRLDCRDGQGYFLSRPVGADAARAMAEARPAAIPAPRRHRSRAA